MKIKQIYHIGLPCNDLERATKFYTDVLGMKCTKVGFDTDSGGPYKSLRSFSGNFATIYGRWNVFGTFPKAETD